MYRPSRLILSMTKPIRARHLILIVGLGLSLAPGTFAAGTHPFKLGSHGDALVQVTHPGNSPEGAGANPTEARPDLVIVQAPEVRSGPLCPSIPPGQPFGEVGTLRPPPHSLTPDFFAAADPRTSFDGARVLFAGKKTADSPWQIWEMNVDGSGARQITHCPGDCLKPAYLPRGEIVYTALSEDRRRSPQWRRFALYPQSHAGIHPDRRNLSTLGQQSGWV